MFHALISLVLTINLHAATHQRHHHQLVTLRPSSPTTCQWVQTATLGSAPRCV